MDGSYVALAGGGSRSIGELVLGDLDRARKQRAVAHGGAGMAGSVNKVILVGNLGADPEVQRTQDGRSIANLRLAASELARQEFGRGHENTE